MEGSSFTSSVFMQKKIAGPAEHMGTGDQSSIIFSIRGKWLVIPIKQAVPTGFENVPPGLFWNLLLQPRSFVREYSRTLLTTSNLHLITLIKSLIINMKTTSFTISCSVQQCLLIIVAGKLFRNNFCSGLAFFFDPPIRTQVLTSLISVVSDFFHTCRLVQTFSTCIMNVLNSSFFRASCRV